MSRMTLRRRQTIEASLVFGFLVAFMPIDWNFSKFEDYFYPYMSYEFGFRSPKSDAYLFDFRVIEHNDRPLEQHMSIEEFVRWRGQKWYANRSYRALYALGEAVSYGHKETEERYRSIVREKMLYLKQGESVRYQVWLRKVTPLIFLKSGQPDFEKQLAEFTETGSEK
jgi:hypothetical protein